MSGQREARALAAVIGVVVVVGLVASVAGVPDHVAATVLAAVALVWVAVLLLRRERRIRARLADPRTHRPAHPSVGVPGGPPTGPPSPRGPAATAVALFDRLTQCAPDAGRADRTGGAR